jgi:hypothetical protein
MVFPGPSPSGRIRPVPGPSPLRQKVQDAIAPYLGRKTAESAVRISAATWLKVEPDALTLEHLPRLREGLAPMLKTLLGAETAAAVLARIDEEARR